MTSSDLCDITRGLQEAAAATTSLIAQQYIKLFDQFFDCDNHDLGAPMKAKMVEVAMDERHSMKVPLIALVAPRGLALERMQVDLSVKIQGTEQAAFRQALASDELRHERFFVKVGANRRQGEQRDPDEVQIRLQFQACEPPEAMNRLIEEYTNLMSPYRLPEVRPTAAPTPPSASSNEFIDAATVRRD
ncbi:hypothetical protein DCO48_15475 [Pseudomonas sp. SDI]|uniref:DUF2589 domain-containing protein n=1 Tax=Pseudomonas sp. SDI TaxID=2170734 RepID=UPI000DE793A7|nr:DUF2589 domain-containing protein [Pseudomonas sp. SDI]PWB31905.1 hypothetical protein DCO48_15475 [Pseudomonas sp. SDI]